MLRKRGKIAMEKQALNEERVKIQRENGIMRHSGDEEAYEDELKERANYRRNVKIHEKSGGYVYKVKGKKYADITCNGWQGDVFFEELDHGQEYDIELDQLVPWTTSSRVDWATLAEE